jgi:hypothetical protein
MSSIHEQFSEQYRRYERRGRGWDVYDEPISPEPPFEPFQGYILAHAIDDGRRPTMMSALVSRLSEMLSTQKAEEPLCDELTLSEPEPESLLRDEDLVELQTILPSKLDIPREAFSSFLSHLSVCNEPVSFELVGTSETISAQFVAHPTDVSLLRRQLMSYFPEAIFTPTAGTLKPFGEGSGDRAMVEFGLEREFFYPLAKGHKIDPFVSLTGALSELRESEFAVCQIIFQPCRHPWPKSIVRLVTDPDGRALFVNKPELVSLAKEKAAKPLYAAVVRFAAKSDSFDAAWEILRNLSGALRIFADPEGNEFIPLRNDEYPFGAHIEDVLKRQTRRSGMLLSIDELIGLVHLPSAAVRGAKFRRQATNTKPAPAIVRQSEGLVLGNNVYAGQTTVARLNADQRTQHVHVIGASGTGKSTFLFNCIKQDIEAGEGLAVLDPHGDLIERILGVIPEQRIKDVVLIDPGDEEYSVGFNILSAHSELEKNLLASDLVSVFQRLSTSWGDQMGSVLNNAILAFLESTQGGTLADLQRFLIEPTFRTEFLKTVKDPQVVYYWTKAFPLLTGNKSIGPVLTRLGGFLDRKQIRYMVTQKENRLDFAEIMNTKKIFLAKLAQGLIGNENAYLLGSFFLSKFQQLAMSRQAQTASNRKNFWCYCDEFHNFITPSMAQILTGARKYRFGLILAHQELKQLQRDAEVGSAVLSNPYTRVVFRVGDSDARSLENGFSSFLARDLQNLGTGEAILRVERTDFDFNISVPSPEEFSPDRAAFLRAAAVAYSRDAYAKPRSHIEVDVFKPNESEGMVKTSIESAKPFTKSTARSSSEPPASVSRLESPPVITESPISKPLEIPQPESAFKSPADLGRGGEQHKAIQRRLKEAAEKLGFLATTEKPILERSGSVDLAIESSQHKIAVEITITTTIDHEVGNVLKCLRADFPTVAVVSSRESKLEQMKMALAGALGPEVSSRVDYFLPDQFVEYLTKLSLIASKDSKAPNQIVRRGYKIKRSAPHLNADELKKKEEAALQLLAETMKVKGPR